MNFSQAAEASGIIPKEKLASLIASLSRRPDFSWTLTAPHPNEQRLQGDLLADFPMAIVDPEGKPQCARWTVILLSNTCDLQLDRSQFVNVAPALDFEKYAHFVRNQTDERKAKDHLSSVVRNEVDNLLWLPSRLTGFADGALVFLDRIGAVASKVYEDSLKRGLRIASCSQTGFYFLLMKLTNNLARSESSEIVRLEAA